MISNNPFLDFRGLLADKPAAVKVCAAVGIISIFFVIATILTAPIVKYVEDEALMLRLAQLVSASLCFVAGPIAAMYILSRERVSKMLGLERTHCLRYAVWVVISMLSVIPLINLSAAVNANITLPDQLQWLYDAIRGEEEDVMRETEKLLATGSVLDFILNIIAIALLPAIGEEILFRGLIQRSLHDSGLSVFVSILITSVAFSAAHMQFLSFLPRFLLSIYLGYLYVWGRSLYLNAVAHFTNNAVVIVTCFICMRVNGSLPDDIGSPEKVDIDTAMCIMSLVTTAIFLLIARHVQKGVESLK